MTTEHKGVPVKVLTSQDPGSKKWSCRSWIDLGVNGPTEIMVMVPVEYETEKQAEDAGMKRAAGAISRSNRKRGIRN